MIDVLSFDVSLVDLQEFCINSQMNIFTRKQRIHSDVCTNSVNTFDARACKYLWKHKRIYWIYEDFAYSTWDYLYKVDCELANQIFYAAYYENILMKCGSPEQ